MLDDGGVGEELASSPVSRSASSMRRADDVLDVTLQRVYGRLEAASPPRRRSPQKRAPQMWSPSPRPSSPQPPSNFLVEDLRGGNSYDASRRSWSPLYDASPRSWTRSGSWPGAGDEEPSPHSITAMLLLSGSPPVPSPIRVGPAPQALKVPALRAVASSANVGTVPLGAPSKEAAAAAKPTVALTLPSLASREQLVDAHAGAPPAMALMATSPASVGLDDIKDAFAVARGRAVAGAKAITASKSLAQLPSPSSSPSPTPSLSRPPEQQSPSLTGAKKGAPPFTGVLPSVAWRASSPSRASGMPQSTSAPSAATLSDGWAAIRRARRSGLAFEKLLDAALPQLPKVLDLSDGRGRKQLREMLLGNLKRLTDVFRELDLDHSGELDRNEMTKLVSKMCNEFHVYPPARSELASFFDEFDKDKSGYISLVEFTQSLRAGAAHVESKGRKTSSRAGGERSGSHGDYRSAADTADDGADEFYEMLFANGDGQPDPYLESVRKGQP